MRVVAIHGGREQHHTLKGVVLLPTAVNRRDSHWLNFGSRFSMNARTASAWSGRRRISRMA